MEVCVVGGEGMLLSKRQVIDRFFSGALSESALNKFVSQGRLRVVRCGTRVFFDEQYLQERLQRGQILEPPTRRKPAKTARAEAVR